MKNNVYQLCFARMDSSDGNTKDCRNSSNEFGNRRSCNYNSQKQHPILDAQLDSPAAQEESVEEEWTGELEEFTTTERTAPGGESEQQSVDTISAGAEDNCCEVADGSEDSVHTVADEISEGGGTSPGEVALLPWEQYSCVL